MKIAINCVFFQPKAGGVREYMHNLLIHLAKIDFTNEYIIYVLEDMMDYAKSMLPSRFIYKSIPFGSGSKLEVIRRSLLENRFWLEEEKKEKWDLFHSPFFHSPKLKQTPVILTVHDMRFYRFPETYARLRYQFLKRKVKSSVERADHIISISDFTKSELMEAYKIDHNKISVVYEAINPERFSLKVDKRPSDVPENIEKNRFLLSVGHLEPRKNYNRLIDAFHLLKRNPGNEDLKLVIVGKKDHSYEETLRKIEADPDILYLNFVAFETLVWLYKHTELFVFPSIYEGFGFPPLEAACQDTVSAVSDTSCIPEICGYAALYFDPYDENIMAQTIERGLKKGVEYQDVKSKLKYRLDSFSWHKNAEETLNIYRRYKKQAN